MSTLQTQTIHYIDKCVSAKMVGMWLTGYRWLVSGSEGGGTMSFMNGWSRSRRRAERDMNAAVVSLTEHMNRLHMQPAAHEWENELRRRHDHGEP